MLIIVQNLPVPLDRRVWLECQALTEAGHTVSVICPKGEGDPTYAELEGVHLYKYRPRAASSGVLAFAVEFAYSWLMTALLSLRVAFARGFDVIQACNPPDTYALLAALYKPFGVTFVFDQHDLCPEVFLSRFGEPEGLAARLQFRLLLWLERFTYRMADHVIVTNESYKQKAVQRGDLPDERITIVRSGPNTADMRPVRTAPPLPAGQSYLACYLGVMGPQDGVDIVLRALDVIVHRFGRTDTHVALLGFGDCFDELVALAHELELDDYVTFTGRADQNMIATYLSAADIGLSPDPLNPLNDVSTMNKTMEYMAFAVPVVAFDLKETRVSAGSAAVYIPPTDIDEYAKAIVELLDDPARRAEMAVAARQRAVAVLDWEEQRRHYVKVFAGLLGTDGADADGDEASWPQVDRRSQAPRIRLTNRFGHELVDLRRPGALEQHVRSRQSQRDELAG